MCDYFSVLALCELGQVTFAWMNLTVSFTISAAHQQSAIQAVAFCGNESSSFWGALVLPTFGHKKGLLWQGEQLVAKNCAMQSLFVDRRFCFFLQGTPRRPGATADSSGWQVPSAQPPE